MAQARSASVTGKDGGHIAESLLGKGYRVSGSTEGRMTRVARWRRPGSPRVTLIEEDLIDPPSPVRAVEPPSPDEVTAKDVPDVPEAVRLTGHERTIGDCRASTSETLGGPDHDRPRTGCNEESPARLRSPHSVLVSHGVLFGNEGEHRGVDFVTREITHATAGIAPGPQYPTELGDPWPERDRRHAGDDAGEMWRTLQHAEPDDVPATEETIRSKSSSPSPKRASTSGDPPRCGTPPSCTASKLASSSSPSKPKRHGAGVARSGSPGSSRA